MRNELEHLINYLNEIKLIPVNDMADKVGLTRDQFYNTRRAAKDGKLKLLMEQLKQIYAKELVGYRYDTINQEKDDIQDKYVRLLEQQNEILTKQQEILTRERNLLESELLEKIKHLQQLLDEAKSKS